MKVFLDLNYHFFTEKSSKEITTKYNANFGYLFYLKNKFHTVSLIQTSYNATENIKNVKIIAHKGRILKKIDFPFKFHNQLKNINPHYILIHGLRYGLFSFFLKRKFKNAFILVQVHGYAKNPSGLKKKLYQWGEKYIDGFIFTGKGNAKSWVDSKVFSENKVFEVMEGAIKSPHKNNNQQKESNTFLWVGRLIPSKDPIIVLNAFESYLDVNPLAKLKMVFNADDLLHHVKDRINTSSALKERIVLIGALEKKALEKLYIKSQFFITGSHYEGSGYALLEAMAFGCIPIITKIPSHDFMTGYGKCGFLYEPRNKKELIERLIHLKEINLEAEQAKVYTQFQKKLSFEAIAEDIYTIFMKLAKNKDYE